jgi:ABC-type transporter Mla subunit MlaD
MPRETHWRDLTLGLLALALVGAGAVAVLLFARVGALRGRTVRLHAVVAEARGVLPGTEVWLAGQKIGTVTAVGFRPPSTDTTLRVLVAFDVLAAQQSQIRRDAQVRIQPGGSFIGAPVLAIGSGTSASPGIRANDTLRSAPAREFGAMRLELASATAQLPAIIANVRVLAGQLGATRGTLGALGIEGKQRLEQVGGELGQVTSRALRGTGTVAATLRGGPLAAHARHQMALVDSVRTLLGSDATSFGRLRRDSTLARTVVALQRELGVVQAALAEPRGSAGRVQHDSALVDEVARTRRELDALVADFRRNPARYVPF